MNTLGLPIELYTVGGKSRFKIPTEPVPPDYKGGVDLPRETKTRDISYLVCHDWRTNKHYSYGFEPDKVSVDEARKNFEKDLEANLATKFDPDGGRLDGADVEQHPRCPECGADHRGMSHGRWLEWQ